MQRKGNWISHYRTVPKANYLHMLEETPSPNVQRHTLCCHIVFLVDQCSRSDRSYTCASGRLLQSDFLRKLALQVELTTFLTLPTSSMQDMQASWFSFSVTSHLRTWTYTIGNRGSFDDCQSLVNAAIRCANAKIGFRLAGSNRRWVLRPIIEPASHLEGYERRPAWFENVPVLWEDRFEHVLHVFAQISKVNNCAGPFAASRDFVTAAYDFGEVDRNFIAPLLFVHSKMFPHHLCSNVLK